MIKTQVTFAFAVLGFLLLAGRDVAQAGDNAIDSAPRTWTAREGGYTSKATLIQYKDGEVQLKKQDGRIRSVPIDTLSDADQEYVKKRAGSVQAAEDKAQSRLSDAGETSEMVVKCQRLCEELTKGYKGKDSGGKATIAVVEFSDLSGGVTDFGRLLSEELITKMFATGKYKVIERLLLNKAIAEHKLQLQGIVDPKSAKELGRILGVDAIVSGTIATLGDSLRVNARLIATGTGEVLSVAAVAIVKDDSIKELLAKAGGEPTTRGSDGSSSPDAKNSHEMLANQTLAQATAKGKSYIGTIAYEEERQRILVKFIEQDGFLIQAEVSNPDNPKQKRIFAGEVISNPQPENDRQTYQIKMNAVGEQSEYFVQDAMDLNHLYRNPPFVLKFRLSDIGLEGVAASSISYLKVNFTIRLKPGTASATNAIRPANTTASQKGPLEVIGPTMN